MVQAAGYCGVQIASGSDDVFSQNLLEDQCLFIQAHCVDNSAAQKERRIPRQIQAGDRIGFDTQSYGGKVRLAFLIS